MPAAADHSGEHPETLARTPRRGVWAAFGALLLVFTVLVAGTAAGLGTTVDEPKYYNGARLILRDGWTVPSTRLQGPLPLYASQLLVPDFPDDRYENSDEAESLFLRGRLGLLPFAWLGALVLFLWSRRLFGDIGGLFSVALFVLNPIVVGYSALITVDIPFASCALLALFVTWRFVARPSIGGGLAAGGALGVAFATKYLALLYGPFVVIAAAVGAWLRPFGKGEPPSRPLAALSTAVLVTLASIVTLHACYGFQAGLAPRDASEYDSELIRGLIEKPVVGHFLGSFPDPFLRGVDLQAGIGELDHSVYHNGRFAAGHNGYYASALARKTPELVGLLVLWVLLAQVPRWFGRRAPASWRSTAWVLLPPTLALFVYVSFFTTLQIGIRYVLPLYPAAFLCCGVMAWSRDGRLRAPRAVLLALPLLHGAAALLFAAPNVLAYYNSVSGGMAQGYRYFSDSNSEWGQTVLLGTAELESAGYPLLTAFGGPRLGRVAIGIVDRVRPDREERSRRWHWLDALEPTRTIEAAYFAFDVTAEAWRAALAELPEDEADRRRAELVIALLGAERLEDAQAELERVSADRAAPLEALQAAVVPAAASDANDAALVTAARAWLGVGRNDLAEGILRRAQGGVNPVMLAGAVMKQGRLHEAIELLEHEDFDRFPIASLTLARYYHAAARYEEAVRLLERTQHLHQGALAEPAHELYQEVLYEHETYSRALRIMRGTADD